MRGRPLYSHPIIGRSTTQTLSSTAFFSTASSSGGGRGRGSSATPSPFGFTPNAPGKPNPVEPDDSPTPPGFGHGRGKALPSSTILPSFSSLNAASSSSGRGRGNANLPPTEGPKKPTFSVRDAITEMGQNSPIKDPGAFGGLRESLLSAVNVGAGRGMPGAGMPPPRVQDDNRHLRASPERGRVATKWPAGPKMSREDAVKKAMGVLSKGGGGGGGEGGSGREKTGFRGGRDLRGGRGGRGRFRGRGRGRGRGGREDEDHDDVASGLYLGDNADGERLAERLGADRMNQLVEGFEEMGSRVLPSPLDDAYLDALHTNYAIECEPEYLMPEFDANPDIDEKPPIPLRDALEKMKPFLMAYENIQSQEEWEEVVEETMQKVPIFKEIVDYYSGPDRVTAKKQQEELERVAETLPQSAPASVKQFANRAVLSLQSNPGWGFDKKCQFMDKLVMEVSQLYK